MQNGKTVNVMIGKIRSQAVSEGCAVKHLYSSNDLEQAVQGQRVAICTASFIKGHTLSLSAHTQRLFLLCHHKPSISSVDLY